jgi:hypothetical protein
MSAPVPGEPSEQGAREALEQIQRAMLDEAIGRAPRRLPEMPTKGRVVVACVDNEYAAIKGARGEGCDYFLSPWVEAGQVFWVDIDAALNAITGGRDV